MTDTQKTARTLWLLRGDHTVDGWGPLEQDARAGETAVVIFDRGAGWALVAAEEAPSGYEGMVPEAPKDGMYVSEHGYPIYVAACKEVRNAKAVVDAIGGKAATLLDDIGDADAVLQRLGYAY